MNSEYIIILNELKSKLTGLFLDMLLAKCCTFVMVTSIKQI